MQCLLGIRSFLYIIGNIRSFLQLLHLLHTKLQLLLMTQHIPAHFHQHTGLKFMQQLLAYIPVFRINAAAFILKHKGQVRCSLCCYTAVHTDNQRCQLSLVSVV